MPSQTMSRFMEMVMSNSLSMMRSILSRHKENRDFFLKNKCELGTRHSEQMIFDWMVRLFVVESFGGEHV